MHCRTKFSHQQCRRSGFENGFFETICSALSLQKTETMGMRSNLKKGAVI
jgi:hypothetical protein